MWWLYDEKDLYVRASNMDEATELVKILVSRKDPKFDINKQLILQVVYDSGARSVHVYGDLYVLFGKDDKQLYVGSLDDCDMTLLDNEGDCGRVRMDYVLGVSAVWSEGDLPPSTHL